MSKNNMQIKLSFNSELDVFLAKQHVKYSVNVYHKNGKILTVHGFSQSFTVEEIFERMRRKFANKVLELEIEIKN